MTAVGQIERSLTPAASLLPRDARIQTRNAVRGVSVPSSDIELPDNLLALAWGNFHDSRRWSIKRVAHVELDVLVVQLKNGSAPIGIHADRVVVPSKIGGFRVLIYVENGGATIARIRIGIWVAGSTTFQDSVVSIIHDGQSQLRPA